MANIHYNRTTTLEKREKIIALWTSGSRTGTNRRSWIMAANAIQYCEPIPSTRDVFPWKAWLEGTNSFYPVSLLNF